jgi:hypothetical protein
MKRDMDLIRLLLMRSSGYDVAKDLEPYSDQERAFHVALLKDAGYVDAVIRTDAKGFPNGSVVIRLTWQGYEFLQAMTDSKIWKSAKEHILKPGVSWTTSLLLEWLKLEARRHIPGFPDIAPKTH